MLKTFAAATFALAMLPGPAAGQEMRGAAVVDAQFDLLTRELGLTPGAGVRGRLARDGAQVASIDVPGGDFYIVGACDESCRDLDLIVRDAAGREVGRDFESDDVPIVAVTGGAAGRYTLEVSMADCTGQCHWGVGVFR